MESQLILEVIAVDLKIISRSPLEIRIESIGTTPTAGWHTPHLVPHTYTMQPLDSIYDFDFEAFPSDRGLSGSPEIRADHRAVLPAHAVGIRVISQLNAIETDIPTSTVSTDAF